MDTRIALLIIIFCILVCKCDSIESFISSKKICNDVDKRCYSIVGKYEPSTHEEASELLAYLNSFSIKLIRHLREKYLWNKQGSIYKQNMVKFLLNNYNPDSIIENAPATSENTSYVEDKGKVFAICLREKSSGKHKFHDKHTLEFVVLHELTHMATKEYGHDKVFWTNFKIILQEANEISLHRPIDYSKQNVVYCSLKLDYNPFFDNDLVTY